MDESKQTSKTSFDKVGKIVSLVLVCVIGVLLIFGVLQLAGVLSLFGGRAGAPDNQSPLWQEPGPFASGVGPGGGYAGDHNDQPAGFGEETSAPSMSGGASSPGAGEIVMTPEEPVEGTGNPYYEEQMALRAEIAAIGKQADDINAMLLQAYNEVTAKVKERQDIFDGYMVDYSRALAKAQDLRAKWDEDQFNTELYNQLNAAVAEVTAYVSRLNTENAAITALVDNYMAQVEPYVAQRDALIAQADELLAEYAELKVLADQAIAEFNEKNSSSAA